MKKVRKSFRGPGRKGIKGHADKGMKLIQFSPEDTKWYVDLAYKAGWEEVIKKSPDLGPS